MPSQEFVRAVCDAGTAAVDCGHCGKTNVAGGNDYWESEDEAEREYAEILKEAKSSDRYLIFDTDAISFGSLGGKTFVEGCCDEVWDRYENFIIDSQSLMITFLSARAKRLTEEAKQNASAIDGL